MTSEISATAVWITNQSTEVIAARPNPVCNTCSHPPISIRTRKTDQFWIRCSCPHWAAPRVWEKKQTASPTLVEAASWILGYRLEWGWCRCASSQKAPPSCYEMTWDPGSVERYWHFFSYEVEVFNWDQSRQKWQYYCLKRKSKKTAAPQICSAFYMSVFPQKIRNT